MVHTWLKKINLIDRQGNCQIANIEKEIEMQNIASKYGFTPKIIKTWTDTEYYYILMEYLDELCLADKYGENSSDIPDELWNKMRDILIILYESEGIEYIDITGYNFIEKQNQIYLIDFGHARWTKPNNNNNKLPSNWFLRKFIDYSNSTNEFNPDFK